jgi:hypothetical protein
VLHTGRFKHVPSAVEILQPVSLSGKMLVNSVAGRLPPLAAAVAEVDETCVVQMVNRSPRRISYMVFAYHRLIYLTASAGVQWRHGEETESANQYQGTVVFHQHLQASLCRLFYFAEHGPVEQIDNASCE